MGILSSILHPSRPYKKAMEQQEAYYQQAQGALSPYMQQGQSAYEPYMNAIQSLLNPTDQLNEWAQGYEKSPYAQMMQEEAMDQGLGAASSMGLMGSSAAMNALQRGNAMIGAQDQQNYINRLIGQYLSGTQAAGNLYGTGAAAAGGMSQNAMNQGADMANLTYAREVAPGNALMSVLGGGLGTYSTAQGGGQGGGGGANLTALLGML